MDLCGGWPDEAFEGRDFWPWDAEAGADEFVERQFQLMQVLATPSMMRRASRPLSLTVPPEIFLFVTKARMSFSEELVLIGISGRSRTRRSPSLLRNSRLSSLSSVTWPVLARLKIRSKRARKSWACFTLGASL